jgi:hypothetical protein
VHCPTDRHKGNQTCRNHHKNGDQGRKKKNRGNEPIQIIIDIYMEMSQGNSLCSYIKQTIMSFFFFYKIREQEG